MGKLNVCLSDTTERLVKREVETAYYGRTGALSIFFESLVRKYFEDPKKPLHPQVNNPKMK